jgi:hypothetical protein
MKRNAFWWIAGVLAATVVLIVVLTHRSAEQRPPSLNGAAGATSAPHRVVIVVQTPSAAPTASATPVANASASPAPSPAHPSAEPSGAGTLKPNAEAVVTAPPAGPAVPTLPPIEVLPPKAAPRILAVTLSSNVVTGGQLVSGTVETSSNVAAVEARIGGYSASLRKVDVGRFVLTYRVPNLPFFLHRTYDLQVIARNTAGDAASTAVPITVH